MTEQVGGPEQAGGLALEGPDGAMNAEALAEANVDHGYSKDYWDIVFEQLGRRKLFKLGLGILAILYSVAIFAPVLANDRPFKLVAADYKGYSDALRRPRLAARSVGEQAVKLGGELTAEEREVALLAVDAEAEGLDLALESIRTSLPSSAHGPFDEFEAAFDAAVTAVKAGGADAAELAKQAQDLGTAIRKEQKARPPDAEEDAAGLVLQPQVSYPLFESVPPRDIFLMILTVLVVTWPVWNRLLNTVVLSRNRDRIRTWRKIKVGGVLGASFLGAFLWSSFDVGERLLFEEGPYKRGLTSGDISVVGTPKFPLLSYGYAEQHSEESFRAPTWTKSAQMDERGVYVNLDISEEAAERAVPVEIRYSEPERNAPNRHLAGTDESGRDFLVRMIWGARVSLSVGVLSAFLLTLIGVTIGSFAGYFGGWVDILIMRMIEIIQSIPAFFLILATLAFLPSDTLDPIYAVVLIIALIRWTGVARLVRGEFLKLRESEFVVAAEALGFSSRRTIFRHVLPNALSPVLVSAAFAVAAGILTESAVSYLGFGVRAPGASWGSLVNESKDPTHWWVQVFPGVLIFITVTCYNLVGDAVRDALDPKMKV